MAELMEKMITISMDGDISRAKKIIKEIAISSGFSPLQVDELIIVVSELTSNILRHAGKGQLIISNLDDVVPHIKIESYDNGPGIGDIELAIGDGFSTAGSLGYGLGTVNRLMDTLDIQSRSLNNEGTYVCCTKMATNPHPISAPCPFSVSVATRPYPGLKINGDTFVSTWNNDQLLVGVIDGLGHGQLAHKAAEKIKQYVISHFHLPLDLIFHGASRESRSGRGGVMALGRLTIENNMTQLTYASVGNVEARVIGEESQTLPIRRGILGKGTVRPIVHTQQLQFNDSLVIFSDGISTRWSDSDMQKLQSNVTKNCATDLLNSLEKNKDDATLLIVRQNKKRISS